ncbi:hypothetical protein J5X84_03725 [Streptosporangiaceae bacterium NEAU-GS5]|nr:hypothetical protein [Streptosporangiaceae bacterium NEAU-GS5]
MTITHPLGRVGAAVAALFVGLLALFALSPAAAHAAAAPAPPTPAQVVAAWKTGNPLYVVDGSALSSKEASDISDTLKEYRNRNIYAVALPDGTITTSSAASTYLRSLSNALRDAGKSENVVAALDGKTLFAGSNYVQAGRLASLATGANKDVVSGMQDFAKRVDLAAQRNPDALKNDPVGGGGGGAGVLIGIGAVAVIGGGGLWIISRRMKRQREAKAAAELAAVSKTVEEDVTKFGEEITALDMDVRMLPAGSDTTGDWQRALDSYERAKTELDAVKRPEDLRTVTATLEDGRYALACVKARVNNQAVPERRPPCFFNPQHGPSVRDVRWAPPGGAAREVPACAMDAEAVERGFDPQMREVVTVGGQRMPYWNAGPAYQPYASGYYGGFGGDLLTGMLVGTLLGSSFGGWGYGGVGGYGSGYDAGYQQGVESGGGDFGGGGDWGGGGGDFGGGGGGDWGGGDFGGGDFGGGDW